MSRLLTLATAGLPPRRAEWGAAIALGVGAVVAAVTVLASRAQLDEGTPGVLAVTVPVPALLLLATALVTARAERSFRMGLETGVLALVASFAPPCSSNCTRTPSTTACAGCRN